jgi:drug/metabolite transporter (DMT)-like permease
MNKGVYFAAMTAILWGFLAIALKVVLYELPPITVAWFRFSISFVLLFLFYLIFDRKKTFILVKPPFFAILAGIFIGINYVGFIIGIQYTSPNISQVFIQAGPVLLALSGFILFKEKIFLRQGIGLIVVLLGMVIFYHETIIKLASGAANYKTGVLWVLLGAVAWAAYAIAQKKAVIEHNPMQLNLILFGLPSLYLLPFVEFPKFSGVTSMGWGMLLFAGLNTLASYGFLAYALKYLQANKISVIITLNPIITFVLMEILTRRKVDWIQPETITFYAALGALTVISGVIMVVIRKKR